MTKIVVESANKKSSVTITLNNVDDAQYKIIKEYLFNELESQPKAYVAVSKAFDKAIALCPKENPSDIWRYLIYRPYLETASDQSWKRVGGQALEIFFVNFYNRYLPEFNLRLISLSRATTAFEEMNILSKVGKSKLDIAIVGKCKDSKWRIIGGIHSKASLAERITDDAHASQVMISNGYYSPLLTLDMKAYPPPGGDEVNKGELQIPKRSGTESDKRNYFERDGQFSACYSYNLRTPPSPNNSFVKSRIKTLNFSDKQPDEFVKDTIGYFESIKDAILVKPITKIYSDS